jgi:multidrug efflux pump subunit AcrB
MVTSRRDSPAPFMAYSTVLRMKYWVIGTTAALFLVGLVGLQFVQQQFFPASDRPELLVDLTLPQSSSIRATRKVVDEFEKILKTDPDIDHWSFYVGSGAVRFYLPLDQQLTNDFFAQGVIVTKGFKVRSAVQKRILDALQRPEFEQVMSRVNPLENGPPVGWPLKFRVSGPDPDKVRELAHRFGSLLGNTPSARKEAQRLGFRAHVLAAGRQPHHRGGMLMARPRWYVRRIERLAQRAARPPPRQHVDRDALALEYAASSSAGAVLRFG